MTKPSVMWLYLLISMLACSNHADTKQPTNTLAKQKAGGQPVLKRNGAKIIHVFVALCDNKYQGIVKVPERIGNGQDPANNLYWGAGFGVKSFLKKQPHWQLISSGYIEQPFKVLERCVFKHKTQNAYLVADAYDGREIKQCTIDFLQSCSGNFIDSFEVNGKIIPCGGSADVLAYTGHDGLMDFQLNETYKAADTLRRQAMILACISKHYFRDQLKATGATPLLWTTGLCSPEAYTLDAALQSWLDKETPQQSQQKAAQAYSKYQHCSVNAAARLFVTGW
jgi:hypothetical protein